MTNRQTHFTEQGAALDDAFATLATKADLAKMEERFDSRTQAMEERFDHRTQAILQAVQNLAGRVDEMSRQLAALRK